MEAINTNKSTAAAVCRFRCWYEGKQLKELENNNKKPLQLLKQFILEIRLTSKENKGKEYEPGSLQTYRSGLRR